MEVAIARQPILNMDESIFAYELLFRPLSELNDKCDWDKATARVVTDSLDMIGLKDLTRGKKAFINFTEEFFKKEIPTILPQKKVGIEIVETVQVNERIIQACKNLQERGYTLILDDFSYDSSYLPLLKIAEIVKIDFLNTTPEERSSLLEKLKGQDIKLLAEKVETRAEFEEAQECGYSYLQGYYFYRPNIVSGQTLPVNKINQIKLLNEVNSLEPDFAKIEQFLKRDVSMAYSILRIINSPYYALRSRVNSIKQAVVLLGLKEFKKWLNLHILRDMGTDKTEILIINSLVRARFCEQCAFLLNKENRKLDFFTMGLFSLIDSILDRSLTHIIEDLHLPQDIVDALLSRSGYGGAIINLISNYERGKWDNVDYYAGRLNIKNKDIARIYFEAVKGTGIIN
ncbi:MAG: EAL and HDOD domain-containing protein, partial [Halanaerobiales bacterium]